MTRRNLLRSLAAIPFIGRLAPDPERRFEWWSGPIDPVLDAEIVRQSPVIHYVGEHWSRTGWTDRHYPTIVEAMERVLPGRGDTIAVAPGHQETLTGKIEGHHFWIPKGEPLYLGGECEFVDNRISSS